MNGENSKLVPSREEIEKEKMYQEIRDFLNKRFHPKIKKLEWEEDTLFSDMIIADTPVQFYRINIIDNKLFIGDTYMTFKSLAAAKTAAQSDFEETVMKCIEIDDNQE